MTAELPSRRPATRVGPLLLALKILVPAVVLWLVTRKVDWPNFFDIVSRLSVGVIAIAIVLITIQNGLAALRWWLIMRRLPNGELGFSAALRYLYVGVFINQALPSSVGGDAVRVWLAYKSGVPLGNSIKSVFIDRVLTMFGLVMMIVIALPIMQRTLPAAPSGLLFLATAPAIVVGFVGLYLLAYIAPFLERYARLKPLVSFLLSVRTFLLSWRNIAAPTLSAVAGFSMMALIVLACARGLRIELAPLDCFVLCPPIFLLAALPISIAGWGVREGGMVVALSYAGVAPEEALVLSLVLGMTVLIGSLPGLLLMMGIFPDRVGALDAWMSSRRRAKDAGHA